MAYTSSDFGAPSFIRTIAEAAGVDTDIITEIETRYVDLGSKYGFFISDEDEIEGFKSLMVFMTDSGHDKTVSLDVMAITDTGVIRHFTAHEDAGRLISYTDGDFVQTVHRIYPSGEKLTSFVKDMRGMTLEALNARAKNTPTHADVGEMHVFHNSSWVRVMQEKLHSHVMHAINMRICPKAYKKIQATSKSRARAIVRGAQKQFKACVDPDILKQANAMTRLDLRALSWLSGDGTAFSRKARLQAAREFPIFIDDFIASADLTALIDAGRPLLPALSAETDISQPILKRLRGKTWRWVGGSPNRIKHNHFIGLDPNDFPTCGKSAKALRDFAKDKSYIIGFGDVKFWNIGPGRPVEMGLVADAGGGKHIHDALCHIINKGVNLCLNGQPIDAHSPMMRAMTAGIYAKAGVKGVLRISDEWHAAQDTIRNIENPQFVVEWSPLLGAGEISDGIFFEEIISKAAIFTLGSNQGHCIASYFDRLLAFSAQKTSADFVFRLHDMNGDTINTVHLTAYLDQKWEVRISQQQARHNRPPSKEAKNAADALPNMLAEALNDQVRRDAYAASISAASDVRNGKNSMKNKELLQKFLIDMLPKTLRTREDLMALQTMCREQLRERPDRFRNVHPPMEFTRNG